MHLRLRIGAVLGVFVALNALFVFAVLWAYGVLLPGLVGGAVVYLQHGTAAVDLFRTPVSWPTYLLLLGGFLVAQAYYGYRHVLSGTGGAPGEYSGENLLQNGAVGDDGGEDFVDDGLRRRRGVGG